MITLNGKRSRALQFGSDLYRGGVFLQNPDVQPKYPYFNPHQRPAETANFVPGQNDPLLGMRGKLDPAMNTTKTQIQSLYKSFTAPKDLKEMDQDPRLVSQLFKYQKQALSWMYGREQEGEEGLIFWKKAGDHWRNVLTEGIVSGRPRTTMGGILADDMVSISII